MNNSWENITAGDKDTYSQVYLLFYDCFYNYGLKFTSDITVVEDSIQEVLLSIWLDRKNLSAIANPEGYFFTSFRNNLIKKTKNKLKLLPVEMGEWEPTFSHDAILINQEGGIELQQKLQKALNNLTSRQREAIFLRFYEGLSYEEVAKALGITVKATYKIVARSLLQLKEQMMLPITTILFILPHANYSL